MQEQPSERFVMRNVLSKISQNSKENIRAEISFLVRLIKTLQICKFIKKRRCFLVNFGKFVRTLTLQRIASRLLLITAVSIGKWELVNKTINYDTKTKARDQLSQNNLAVQLKEQVSEIVVRSCSSKQVFLKILQFPQENICVGVSF